MNVVHSKGREWLTFGLEVVDRCAEASERGFPQQYRPASRHGHGQQHRQHHDAVRDVHVFRESFIASDGSLHAPEGDEEAALQGRVRGLQQRADEGHTGRCVVERVRTVLLECWSSAIQHCIWKPSILAVSRALESRRNLLSSCLTPPYASCLKNPHTSRETLELPSDVEKDTYHEGETEEECLWRTRPQLCASRRD